MESKNIALKVNPNETVRIDFKVYASLRPFVFLVLVLIKAYTSDRPDLLASWQKMCF